VEEKLLAAETEVAELRHKTDELEYHLGSATTKVDKLDKHLYEYIQKYKTLEEGDVKVGGTEGVSKRKVSELQVDTFQFMVHFIL